MDDFKQAFIQFIYETNVEGSNKAPSYVQALDWLNKSILAINVLGLVYGVWIRLGFGCIYFLAAMSGTDESLYDAVKIDGAMTYDLSGHVVLNEPQVITLRS